MGFFLGFSVVVDWLEVLVGGVFFFYYGDGKSIFLLECCGVLFGICLGIGV